jgi:autotransporter-associated beta strand protein
LAVVAGIAVAGRASADTISWQDGLDDWFNQGSWIDYSQTDPNTGNYINQVPGASDYVYIQNGGTAEISYGNAAAYILTLDGGSVSLSGSGSLSVSGNEYVGYNGEGTFTQTGGANVDTAPNALILGANSGSNGTYTLSAGTITLTSPTLANFTYFTEIVGGSGTGTFNQTGGTQTINQSLVVGNVVGSSGNYSLSNTGSLSVGNNEYVGNSGNGTFTQTGGNNTVTQTLILAANAGSSGTYNLDGGTLAASSILVNSAGMLNLNGGILQVTGTTVRGTPTINGNGGAIVLGASGGTINVAVAGTQGATDFSATETAVQCFGNITGTSGGNLNITGGAGTNSGTTPYLLELAGASTYNGNTTVNNATVAIATTGGPFTNVLPSTTILNLINNGWFILDQSTSTQTIAGLTGDVTGVVGETNALTTNVLTIAPAAGQTYSYPGLIGNVTLLGKVGAATSIALVINGSGNGTQILTGTNTYAGGTTINGGTLSISSAANLGGNVTTNSITLNGGTLQLTATAAVTATPTPSINSAGGIILGASGGTINLTKAGTGTFNSGELAFIYTGTITGSNGGNLSVTGGSSTNTGGAPYLLELGGASTYTGNTTINNAIVCPENLGPTSTNILPATTVLTLASNGWLVLNNNTSAQTLVGLINSDGTGVVGTTNGASAATATIDPAAGQSYTYAGLIEPVTVLNKPGAAATLSLVINGNTTGTQILTGANTYAAGTTISSGTLRADNASGSATGPGPIAVRAGTSNYGGGRLGGNGTAGGSVALAGSATATQGGIVAAGGTSTAVGALATGNETWNGGAAYQWKITGAGTAAANPTLSGTPGTNYDLLNISPSITSGSPLTVLIAGLAPFTIAPSGSLTSTPNGRYNWAIARIGSGTSTTISVNGTATSASSSTALSSSVFALDTSGLSINGGADPVTSGLFSLYFETVGSNNDLVLSYNATPEPGAGLLVLAGGLPMLLTRRRRRKDRLYAAAEDRRLPCVGGRRSRDAGSGGAARLSAAHSSTVLT